MRGFWKGKSSVGEVGAVERAPSRETSLQERVDREKAVGGSVLDKKETERERCSGGRIVCTARERR